jgi:hypothetical protein
MSVDAPAWPSVMRAVDELVGSRQLHGGIWYTP